MIIAQYWMHHTQLVKWKKALFSNPGWKAPKTNGFGTFFYRVDWAIIGDDIIKSILDVLQDGRLLKEVSTIIITLLPKTKCLKNFTEYRPISCCNTLFKCITKCGKLRQVLAYLIMENQVCFVHGRYIIHNTMVIQT